MNQLLSNINLTQPSSRKLLTSKPVLSLFANTQTLPALFISHGVPTLALEKSATTKALARIGENLPTPKAIIILSAHWQSGELEINSNPKPTTWHDFTGLDTNLYQLQYPALGMPTLAESLKTQLNEMNINARLNPLQAFDHGVWVPLIHLYPDANIPVIQLSLPKHYDAAACYQLGAKFANLRKEQILVIGSGNITHNPSTMRWNTTSVDKTAKAFKTWLISQLKSNLATALDWRQFKGAHHVHPTPEHLMPLFFALGAGSRCSVIHESMIHHSLGMDIYRFD